ncbi:peptidylprolyl isomerase [Dysgonomonas termitidis]|uniref:Peptidylprolyl isomerase n=1 Tax=Dysgonomonas termitidis TaxID=1516126 RepID=A0ABV9KTW9_9BACT
MIKKLSLLIFALLATLCTFAQQDDTVVFSIDGTPVYKSEVEYAYKKGNANTETKQNFADFVNSYIDFKLNVAEARAQHLDTTASFQRQLSSYRSQMAHKYMNNTGYEDEYIEKIYKRMQENVEINHVMFPFDNEEIVLPGDTLRIYKKAMEARVKILKDGFAGAEPNTPRSGTAFYTRAESRNGYIGWVSPFMFAAKVEDAIYSLPINEVSMPIRASRGYHIIQVLNRRPAMGAVEIEQVVFNFSHLPPSQQQIDSVGKVAWREYENIKSPADYQTLCDLFSKAHKMEANGCYFGIIRLDSNLPMDFTMAAFNLEKAGDISKPVMSNYGYHIIRLLRKIPTESLDVMKNQLREKILKSDKVQALSDEKRRRLKSNFNVTVNKEAFSRLYEITETVSPRDSVFLKMIKNGDDILFGIDGQRAYPVREFAKYISYRQKERIKDTDDISIMQVEEASPYSLSSDILNEYFEGFQAVLLSDYEEDTLDKRFPDFARTMNEFSDGLLYYDVQNKNVWERSKNDAGGLTAYFTKNKARYSLDGQKYKGMVVYAKSEDILKKAEAGAKKATSREAFINEIDGTLNKDSLQVKIEPGIWIKGSNPYVDNKIYGGVAPAPFRGYPYFFVTGKFINAPEDYTDVRYAVELDYQEKLEKDWITYLRNKYKVDINKPALNLKQ